MVEVLQHGRSEPVIETFYLAVRSFFRWRPLHCEVYLLLELLDVVLEISQLVNHQVNVHFWFLRQFGIGD